MVKRTFDIIVSLSLMVFLFPLMLITISLSILYIGRPIFFKQLRPGRHGIVFSMVKFRTMTNLRDSNGNLLDDSERMTKFGNFLRRSSIDELPGLWNVLKGDMSLVGPRPLLVEYLSLYDDSQKRRHDVRPGITGWAQVNGRNAISWEEKFAFDVWYVDNHSFLLDIKILILTVKKVLFKEGITADGHVTAEPFKGNSND